jgi:hypothetical protein
VEKPSENRYAKGVKKEKTHARKVLMAGQRKMEA